MGFTGLEQLESLERRLEDLPERAATRAAPELLRVAQAQWAAGQAPGGETWPLTKEGRVALTSLTRKATARADGAVVELELPDELAYHQAPTQSGHPRRPTLPNEGEGLPPAWEEPLVDVVDAELELALGEG